MSPGPPILFAIKRNGRFVTSSMGASKTGGSTRIDPMEKGFMAVTELGKRSIMSANALDETPEASIPL
jgi:hypothetical protein